MLHRSMYLRMDELIKDMQYIADNPTTVRMCDCAGMHCRCIYVFGSPIKSIHVYVCLSDVFVCLCVGHM
jgi:hypothetical protein